MPDTVILDPTTPNPYLFHADKGSPVEVFVTGDPVVYSDESTLTAADNEGRIEPEVLTAFAEGKYLRSLGRSIVTLAPYAPDPRPPKPKAKSKK